MNLYFKEGKADYDDIASELKYLLKKYHKVVYELLWIVASLCPRGRVTHLELHRLVGSHRFGKETPSPDRPFAVHVPRHFSQEKKSGFVLLICGFYAAYYGAVWLRRGWNGLLVRVSALKRELVRPLVLYKPKLYISEGQWWALYGEDLQAGVAGVGDTPEEAMRDFDKNWVAEKPLYLRMTDPVQHGGVKPKKKG